MFVKFVRYNFEFCILSFIVFKINLGYLSSIILLCSNHEIFWMDFDLLNIIL